MKKIILFLGFTTLFIIPVFASQYGIYTPDKYQKDFNPAQQERLLFILDFSNSMTEQLEGSRKVDLMLNTMKEILPKINPNTWVGLRIYGHRMGFTPMEACRASKLISPISTNNSDNIGYALSQAKPKGMTPITYSLKQAVNVDFAGIEGKKHIILLTDGGENCDESPCTYAIELMKQRDDISIDVIAFDLYDTEANNQLRCTALATRGKFYSAGNSGELTDSLFDSLGIDKDVHGTIKMNE